MGAPSARSVPASSAHFPQCLQQCHAQPNQYFPTLLANKLCQQSGNYLRNNHLAETQRTIRIANIFRKFTRDRSTRTNPKTLLNAPRPKPNESPLPSGNDFQLVPPANSHSGRRTASSVQSALTAIPNRKLSWTHPHTTDLRVAQTQKR